MLLLKSKFATEPELKRRQIQFLSIWVWKDHDYLEATTSKSLAWEIERFD